jgi:hypothetical protein
MRQKRIITRKEIYHIKRQFRIKMGRYVIREDGLIDVYGNFHMLNTQLKKLPLTFGNVSGNFYCSSNKLITLKGCPSYVGGSFNCYGNNLESLEGGPKEVAGNYSCHENVLTSLKGVPQIINGNFACFLNKLVSLKEGPIKVNGSYLADCNELITLEGSPDFVGGSFHVGMNEFLSLVGCPKVIVESFSFDNTVTSLFMGNRGCEVKKVVIQKNERLSTVKTILNQIVFANQQYLHVVMRYSSTLRLFDERGNFNESDFDDIIFDIKDGLR